MLSTASPTDKTRGAALIGNLNSGHMTRRADRSFTRWFEHEKKQNKKQCPASRWTENCDYGSVQTQKRTIMNKSQHKMIFTGRIRADLLKGSERSAMRQLTTVFKSFTSLLQHEIRACLSQAWMLILARILQVSHLHRIDMEQFCVTFKVDNLCLFFPAAMHSFTI